MKAERMIKILILLQYGETVSTPTLARELDVSERTILRDMESLNAAGIPIYSERGTKGGWRLVDHWKQKLSWLKEKEMLSLFIPHANKILADLDIDISAVDIKDKLLLSIPEQSRDRALNLWERVYVDMDTWRNKNVDLTYEMEVFQQAVMTDRKVTIVYKKASGEIKEVTIKPLGLVAKGSTWYLVAMNEREDYRSYKIERVQKSSLLQEYFDRPTCFKLADYWEESKKEFIRNLPEYQVRVKASPSARKRITFTGRFVRSTSVEKESDEGWIDIELTFPTEDEAINFLLGFGDQLQVISPAYLIPKITARAREVIHFYEL